MVNEPKMNNFKEPRLGCYYSIDIRFQGFIEYSPFLNAIENYKEYKVKKEEGDDENIQTEERDFDKSVVLKDFEKASLCLKHRYNGARKNF